jgi:membrane-associated phospholipid phosphatase
MLFYIPINRFAHGGTQLQIPLDRSIPLYPPAIIPYLFGTLLFICFPVWAAFRAETVEFEAYSISILLAMYISYFVYLVFPTFVVRPEILSTDIFSRILNSLYSADKAYNDAPSGHAFYTLLSLLYLSKWRPKLRSIWLVVALLILGSTLLTRQHNILDLVLGLTLGIFAYLVGQMIETKWNAFRAKRDIRVNE